MSAALVRTVDDGAVQLLTALVGRFPALDRLVAGVADHVAKVHVALLGLLFVGGFGAAGRRRRALAIRTSAALALTVAAVGAIGRLVERARPFARLDNVAALVDHAPHRSFPSRHVACAAAMATVARPTAPFLATAMGTLGVLLALSRVYAGLHYPSDVAGGWLIGAAIGRAVRGSTDVGGPE